MQTVPWHVNPFNLQSQPWPLRCFPQALACGSPPLPPSSTVKDPSDYTGSTWMIQDSQSAHPRTLKVITSARSLVSLKFRYSQTPGIRMWTFGVGLGNANHPTYHTGSILPFIRPQRSKRLSGSLFLCERDHELTSAVVTIGFTPVRNDGLCAQPTKGVAPLPQPFWFSSLQDHADA